MPRRLAVDALDKMEKKPCFAREAVQPLLGRFSLTPEDQGFLWEMVHGVIRHKSTIDRVLTAFSRVKLGKVHRRVRQALRVAVYQMVWLDRIPPPAAVNESVEIVKATFPDWVVKFTNGCLRSVSRSLDIKVGGLLPPEDLMRAVPIGGFRNCLFTRPIFPDPREEPVESMAERFGYPAWLVERWLDAYGEEATEGVLRAGNESPILWLRPAPDRMDMMARELRKRRIPFEAEETPEPGAIRLLEPVGQVTDLPGFAQGWFVVQDLSAMRAVELLGPRPGERILDLCAAPGGKTTHIAQLVGPEGLAVAFDRDPKRLARLTETLRRLRIGNVGVVTGDAADEAIAIHGAPFDRVLADVPCSNTGVLGKRPEARHRLTPELIETLTEVQRKILETALRHVKPGGVVAYSTCALTDEENRGLVEAALDDGLPFVIEEERETLPRAGYSDGGYVVRLRRAAE